MEKDILETIEMSWHEGDPGNSFQHKLQRIINKYLHQTNPEKTNHDAKELALHVVDKAGSFLGGAIILVHQDWVEIRLLALIKSMRGFGLGKRMLAMIEEKALELHCERIRTGTCEVNVGFYQRNGYKIWGKIDDYSMGLNYFSLYKGLD